MIEVLKALSVFFAYAVMAVFAQNAVFTRALGVSRLVKGWWTTPLWTP